MTRDHEALQPEPAFEALVSREGERLVALSQSLEALAHTVDEHAEDLALTVHRTRWRGGRASEAFRDAVEDAYLPCVAASWRLDRAAEALRRAGRSCLVLERGANAAMVPWRAGDHSAKTRKRTLDDLAALGTAHDHRLVGAREAMLGVNDQIERWMRSGATRDFRLAVRTGAGRGVRIPDSALNGDRGGWTQQGLAHDPVTGQYLVTSYRGDEAQLTRVDGATGAEAGSVRLGTVPGATDGVPGPKHAGGVSVVGDDVFVVSTEQDGQARLYRYSLAELQAAAPGTTVAAEAKFDGLRGASSYLAVSGDTLYLGNTKPPRLVTAPLAAAGGASGTLPTSGMDWTPPEHANGLVVSPAGFTFAQGSDRDESTSALVHVDAEGHPVHTTPLGNMAEEVELVDGQFVGLSETGSEAFSPWDDKTKHPGRLWGQTNLYELSAATVFGAGGAGAAPLEVDATTLRTAAKELGGVREGLRAVRGTLSAVEVRAEWLGGVPHAKQLAGTATVFLDHTDDPLRAAARRSDRVSDALDETAQRFDTSDGTAADDLAALRRRLR